LVDLNAAKGTGFVVEMVMIAVGGKMVGSEKKKRREKKTQVEEEERV
jgi:hypothetical protein